VLDRKILLTQRKMYFEPPPTREEQEGWRTRTRRHPTGPPPTPHTAHRDLLGERSVHPQAQPTSAMQ